MQCAFPFRLFEDVFGVCVNALLRVVQIAVIRIAADGYLIFHPLFPAARTGVSLRSARLFTFGRMLVLALLPAVFLR